MKILMHKNAESQSDYDDGALDISAEDSEESFMLGRIYQLVCESKKGGVCLEVNGKPTIRLPLIKEGEG